jgi:hypothetical protein
MLGGQLSQAVDSWNYRLTDWWYGSLSEATLAQITATLRSMMPGLLALDRTNCRAEMYASTTRCERMSTLTIPADLVTVLAKGRLDVGMAIICVDLGDDADQADGSRVDRAIESEAHPDQGPARSHGISVRASGQLPPLEVFNQQLGSHLAVHVQPPELARDRPGATPLDSYEIPLVPQEQWMDGRLAPDSSARVSKALEQLRPALAALNRSRCRVELQIAFTCQQDEAGFGLPPEVLAAASAAGLDLSFLILCTYDDPVDDDWVDEIDLDDPETIDQVQHDLDGSMRRWWKP